MDRLENNRVLWSFKCDEKATVVALIDETEKVTIWELVGEGQGAEESWLAGLDLLTEPGPVPDRPGEDE